MPRRLMCSVYLVLLKDANRNLKKALDRLISVHHSCFFFHFSVNVHQTPSQTLQVSSNTLQLCLALTSDCPSVTHSVRHTPLLVSLHQPRFSLMCLPGPSGLLRKKTFAPLQRHLCICSAIFCRLSEVP